MEELVKYTSDKFINYCSLRWEKNRTKNASGGYSGYYMTDDEIIMKKIEDSKSFKLGIIKRVGEKKFVDFEPEKLDQKTINRNQNLQQQKRPVPWKELVQMAKTKGIKSFGVKRPELEKALGVECK